MVYLLEYDRRLGELLRLEEFADDARDMAAEARLQREIALHHSGIDREIVLLEAVSREALMQTHRRYFQTLTQSLDEFVKSTSG